MKIKIIAVGKIKEKYLRDAISEYQKRLTKFSKIEIIEVQEEKANDKLNDKLENIIKLKEAEKVEKNLSESSFKILLDLNGVMIDSIEFSKKIESIKINGFSCIEFIIGGSFGISNSIKEKMDFCISFSKMTFTHQMIRVFLIEQIYRAFKIQNNEVYHK